MAMGIPRGKHTPSQAQKSVTGCAIPSWAVQSRRRPWLESKTCCPSEASWSSALRVTISHFANLPCLYQHNSSVFKFSTSRSLPYLSDCWTKIMLTLESQAHTLVRKRFLPRVAYDSGQLLDAMAFAPGLRVGLFGSTRFYGDDSREFCEAGTFWEMTVAPLWTTAYDCHRLPAV